MSRFRHEDDPMKEHEDLDSIRVELEKARTFTVAMKEKKNVEP